MDKQTLQALEITVLIGLLIKNSKEIPSGQLYAQLMDKMSLNTYETFIVALKKAGVIKEQGNLLMWIGD